MKKKDNKKITKDHESMMYVIQFLDISQNTFGNKIHCI